jgi:carbonic anhydrase
MELVDRLKKDIPAGLVVFLVALPLCLGIALASGAPLISGLIAGMVGGLVVGMISGSHTSVSGPAAGLTAVVLSAITQLKDYEVFLSAVVIAGLLQMIMGAFKIGFIANYVPSSVIKGLLAAIGLILIMNQIPHAFGYDKGKEGDFPLFERGDGESVFTEFINMFSFLEWGAIIISVVSILILIFWNKSPLLKNLKFIPSALVVVLIGVVLNIIFKKYLPSLYLQPTHLVNIPEIDGISSLVITPTFKEIGDFKLWKIAFTIAIVASLESLLNLEAIENIDPHKRLAPPNRELIAQGVGNLCSGLLGGLPVTSVIIRGTVNVYAGAASKMSTILHGFFILLCVFFLSPVFNLIPLASLASILLHTGYKLIRVSLFKEILRKGRMQFIVFTCTIVAIVFTDLFVGILIGLALNLFFVLKSNYKTPFKLEKQKLNIGETLRIELSNQVTFLNKASIKKTLWSLPEHSKVVVDATQSDFIDNDVIEILNDFKNTVSGEKHIQLNIVGLQEEYKSSEQIQFVNVLDKESQQKLTPAEVLDILKKGNERFVKGESIEKYFKHQVTATSMAQNPMAVIVSCIDSRTSPELIFDVGIGDLISIRVAGNIINREIIESIEYSCRELGTRLIAVLGHSHCGAVATAIKWDGEAGIGSITDKIERAIGECTVDRSQIIEDRSMYNTVVKINVRNSINDIRSGSPYLAELIRNNDISIVAGFYETRSGEVIFK